MWKNSPVFRPAIAAFIGMYGMNFCLQHFQISLIACLLAFALTTAISTFIFFKYQKKHIKIYGFFVLLSFSLLGALLFNWKYLKVETASHVGKVLRIGTVTSKPFDKGKWWTFRFKLKDGALNMIYLAKDDSAKLNLMTGDSLYLVSHFNYPTSLRLRTIEQEKYNSKKQQKENFKRKKNREKKNGNKTNTGRDNLSSYNQVRRANNPTSKDSITRAFNLVDDTFEGYKKYLFYQGISSVCFVDKNEWGFFYGSEKGRELQHINMPFYHDLAGKMQNMYKGAGFSDKAEAIMEAMTTGNKDAVDKTVKDNFSKAGISHVLALSGFHLTIIVSLLDLLLLRLYLTRKWRKISAIMVIPAIWAFAFIAGMPPSLVRATSMCSVLQLALVIGNQQQLKNACGIALFVMILCNPLYIMDVGFQLSFLSIIAIATAGIPLCEWMKSKIGKWTYLTDVIVISFVCSLFTFPLVAYHFGRVPLYSIFTNLLISIVAAAFMWTAVFWWIFCWWAMANNLITNILDFLANCMINIAEFVADLPASTIQFKPSLFEMITIYLTGILTFYCIRFRNKTFLISAVASLALTIICHIAY